MVGKQNHNAVDKIDTSLESALDKAIGADSVEADVMRRIRARTRPSRARRRTMALACTAVGVMVAVFVVARLWPERLRIEAVTGDSLIVIDGKERMLDGDASVAVGSSISTRNSMLVMRPSDPCVVVLDEGTDAHLIAGNRLSVEHGRFYYKHDGKEDAMWLFGTPMGTIRPVGTAFDASISDTLGITVHSGVVIVETDEGESRVTAGLHLTVDGLAKIEAKSTARDHPQWWTAAVPARWTDVIQRN